MNIERFLVLDGFVIALFKPQYETRYPKNLERGVIKSDEIREGLFENFKEWAEENGWVIKNKIKSPILGGKGNVEYLLLLHPKQ